jgi:hypothetical protein
MKKAADWLKEDIKDLDKKITVASNFDITKYLYDNKNIEFDYVHFYDKISTKWDYAILGINYVHPYQLKNETWQPEGVLKTFFHKGNPTVIIIKGQDKNAYNGFVAFSNKNFALASNLLTLAHKNDSTDLNILAYLGESYLAQNNYLKVDETVVLGKKINPFYEPFLLLNAKSEIKQGNYKTGIEILRFLFQNNPRYVKALPYLIECYEKTGETETANRIREKFIINEKNISNEKN